MSSLSQGPEMSKSLDPIGKSRDRWGMHYVPRILVTGGAGFIGSFLCERLRHCPTDAFARSSNEGTLSG